MSKTLATAAIVLLLQCSGDDDEAANVQITADQAPTATATATVPVPSHGGTVVAAGPHPFEVVARSDGEVRAYPVGNAPPTASTQLTVRVPDARGSRRPVQLVWNPSENAYVGRARRVQIGPGRIDVSVRVGGARYEGASPSYVIVQVPPRQRQVEVIDVDDDEPTTVVVREPAREPAVVVVERPAPPRPTIIVERPAPPRPTIVVEHPAPPRPTVVVTRPSRPGVVVVHERDDDHRVRVRGRGKFKFRRR